MPPEPMKLGFIGGALESAVGNVHKIASQMDSRFQLCSGCFSTHSGENKNTAEKWHISDDRVYSEWQSLLQNEKDELDAVVVLTPTPAHDEIVTAAIENGYPVICEKALTISSQNARKIKRLLESSKGFLAVTYNYTGYPMLRELRSIIDHGSLGELNQIHVEMPQEGFAKMAKDGGKPAPQKWRLRDTAVPTLSLDLGVHVLHIIRFLIRANPIEVVALNNTYGYFKNIVDNSMCMARYSGNLNCQIWFSKSALGEANGLRVRIYATEGSAQWYQQLPERLCLSDEKGNTNILTMSSPHLHLACESRYNRFKPGHPAGFIEAFANHYYDVADSLHDFKQGKEAASPWVFGVDDALEGLIILEAIARSGVQREWQAVDV